MKFVAVGRKYNRLPSMFPESITIILSIVNKDGIGRSVEVLVWSDRESVEVFPEDASKPENLSDVAAGISRRSRSNQPISF